MAIYGYARVSTDGQTLAAQDAQLHAAGCAKVYSEKVSGAQTDRTELAKLLKRLDEGDVLVGLDRLARSTRDLLKSWIRWPRLALASARWQTPGQTRPRRTAG